MNTTKNIRKRTTRTRIARDNATLDLLRYFGIKRRHAFLKSCRKKYGQKKLHTTVITITLKHAIRDFMREQIMTSLTLKKEYEKPVVLTEYECVELPD